MSESQSCLICGASPTGFWGLCGDCEAFWIAGMLRMLGAVSPDLKERCHMHLGMATDKHMRTSYAILAETLKQMGLVHKNNLPAGLSSPPVAAEDDSVASWAAKLHEERGLTIGK